MANEAQAKAKLNGIAAQKKVDVVDLSTYTDSKDIVIPDLNGHVENEEFDAENGEEVTEAFPVQVSANLEEGCQPSLLQVIVLWGNLPSSLSS